MLLIDYDAIDSMMYKHRQQCAISDPLRWHSV